MFNHNSIVGFQCFTISVKICLMVNMIFAKLYQNIEIESSFLRVDLKEMA